MTDTVRTREDWGGDRDTEREVEVVDGYGIETLTEIKSEGAGLRARTGQSLSTSPAAAWTFDPSAAPTACPAETQRIHSETRSLQLPVDIQLFKGFFAQSIGTPQYNQLNLR